MKLSKTTHKNELRIRVDFPYDVQATALLRQVDDTRWSRTMKCWHVPYTKEVFAQLKELFPELEYESSTPTNFTTINTSSNNTTNTTNTTTTTNNTETTTSSNDERKINIEKQKTTPKKIVLNRKSAEKPDLKIVDTKPVNERTHKSVITITIYPKIIEIKIPKDEADIQFIRSFKYAKWNSNQYSWTVPNYARNADLLTSYFRNKNAEIVVAETPQTLVLKPEDKQQPAFTKTDFLAINTSNRSLSMYFVYNVELSKLLKRMPLCAWNGDKRCWEMPYSDRYLNEVKQMAAQFSLNLIYKEEQKLKVLPRKAKLDIKNYRSCPQNFLNKLIEIRYSKNTMDVYSDMFEEFINYYENTDLDDITEPMIMDFLLYLVNVRHVSSSYQNQSINAIHPVGLFKN